MDIFLSKPAAQASIQHILTPAIQTISKNPLFDVASNFSERRFLRHFHGLKSLPRADSFDLRSTGGVLALALPRLPVRTGPPPFIFLGSAGAVIVFDLLLLAEMKSVRDKDEAIICLFSWKLSCGAPFFATPVCTQTTPDKITISRCTALLN